ncbi:class I SAM-dependent methyltransferase [Deltaproteobacteria bacterium Smac51]|nr:class I SAM-dependent methyltransferase [Deltaproteobacteria bacterium Smac51]
MKIKDIINRSMDVAPWVDGEKIPWNDPGLSQRILASHLSQDTDWASRRFDIIDRQLDWINSRLKPGSRILDLGCGPGFYTQWLIGLGHSCVGVDFSPASIEYARQKAAESGTPEDRLTYILGDIRQYQPDGLFDCVMMIFGEINVFTESDARHIFQMASQALRPGGLFILEGHTFNAVEETGMSPTMWWHAAEGEGLMASEPHLCLQENFWDEAGRTATTRYYIIDGETAETRLFCSSMTAYTEEGYSHLFTGSGFQPPVFLSTEQWPVGAPFEGQMMTMAAVK